MTRDRRPGFLHEAQTSVRNNASAYGYSITITVSFGVVSNLAGTPGLGELFLYAAGAITAFTAVEGVATRGFRVRPRGETPEVVALGSAIGYLSVLGGAGTAALSATLLATAVGWFVAAFLATVAYLLAVALEMLAARRLAPRSASKR